MKAVKIAELKDRLSEYLRLVAQGNELVVTDRSRPVARILPIREQASMTLEAPTVDFAALRDRKWRRVKRKRSSLDVLLEERQE